MSAARTLRPSRRRGATLLEIAIVGTLLTIVAGALGRAVQHGLNLFRQSAANQEVDSRLDRAIRRVTQELDEASLESLSPDLTTVAPASTTWSEWIEFQPVEGWLNGDPVLGDTKRLELRIAQGETDNGLDDDGDGIVDECALVLIDDVGLASEQEVVLLSGVCEFLEGEDGNAADDNGNGLVDEPGLGFDIDGGTLNVRMSVAGTGPTGTEIVRTRVASVFLRN